MGFLDDFKKKIIFLWQKFPIESIFIFASCFILIISLTLFFKTNGLAEEKISFTEEENSSISSKTIFVDISGAVTAPNVYEATASVRLKDILVLAGGLSEEADRDYFKKNFNLARILNDQEKIYIPSRDEVEAGYKIDSYASQVKKELNKNLKININTASLDDLDSLTGIGQVTAEKIIANRPYASVEELTAKKIVKKNVYQEIKDKIAVN